MTSLSEAAVWWIVMLSASALALHAPAVSVLAVVGAYVFRPRAGDVL